MTNLYPIDQRLDFGSVLQGDVFARVFIKQRWADAWVERLDIIATQILWAAAPNYGSASIHRRYGPIVERDGTTHNRVPIELGGWYVKIVVECPDGDRNWHGYVIDIGDEPGGVVDVATIKYATGRQTWSCVGMLAALDRDVLKDSKWYAITTFESPTGSNRRKVLAAPHFNPTIDDLVEGQSIPRQMPNKHPTTDSFHARFYIGNNVDAVHWTPRDIVRYLVAESSPRDELDVVEVSCEIEGITLLPDWSKPELDCEGLTLKQCLDRLLNPSTGLGYWVWVETGTDPDPDVVKIEIFTLTETAIVVNADESYELAATPNVTDLYCGNDPATTYTVQQSLSTRYNRVRAAGARRVVVCTRRFLRGGFPVNWTQGWTTAEETDFLNTLVPIGTNPLEANNQRRDLLEEGRFSRIFRFFNLQASFLRTNDESTDTPTPPVFRLTDGANTYYMPGRYGLRILPDLPLKADIDYTDPIEIDTHETSRAIRRRIAVYGPQHALTGGTNPGHDLNGPKIDWANRSHVDLFYHLGRPNYQISPSPFDDGQAIGLRFDVVGASQSIFGPTLIAASPGTPQLDPSTLIVTLAFEEDRRCEAVYPPDADLPDVDALLELRLEAGDGYRRVDLLKGTVVGYDHEGNYKTVPTDVVLENDADELGNIARLAYEWYNRTRQILRLASRRPTARLWPGVLVRDLNPALTPIAREINTTITEISITLPTNPGVTPGAPRMEIVTSTGDVDFVRYTPRLRV